MNQSFKTKYWHTDFFDFCTCDGFFRVRYKCGGPGFLIKNIQKHPLLFSQRNGLRKSLRLFNLYFEFLWFLK
jgi:hypothetical protein